MSDGDNFHLSGKRRKSFHKHFSFPFPTGDLKFDFHLVGFVEPPQCDLKSVTNDYPAVERRKWQQRNCFTSPKGPSRRMGSMADQQLCATRNGKSEADLALLQLHGIAFGVAGTGKKGMTSCHASGASGWMLGKDSFPKQW